MHPFRTLGDLLKGGMRGVVDRKGQGTERSGFSGTSRDLQGPTLRTGRKASRCERGPATSNDTHEQVKSEDE
jgi:hypothetical protein